MRPRVWIALAGLVVIAVCTVVVLGRAASSSAAASSATGAVARECSRVTAAYDAALHATPRGRTAGLIVVIGDSYSQGEGLPSGRAAAYPALIARDTGRPLLLDGYGSTGFTTSGYCAGRAVNYGERLVRDHLLALHPATVVVEGGVNDARHGAPQRVGAAAAALLHRLARVPQVIVVGPADVAMTDPGALLTVDRALADAARAAGRPYVQLRVHPLPLQGDRTHPTAGGQRIIAALLDPLLRNPAAPDDSPALRG